MPSSADTETEAVEAVVDEARSALLEGLQAGLGDALVEHHLVPGIDLTVRIATPRWAETAEYLREGQRFRFFDFLSAIDWLPSPFGRSMDAAVDATADEETAEAAEMVTGIAGGDTRFQVFARVFNLTTNVGVTLKTDVGDDMTVQTWTDTYAGSDWHEREIWEMFGIQFAGHPGLRPLYLPSDFEGNPMRKDFPLLSRLIKPWPGIVDVEPMPEAEPAEVEAPSESDTPAVSPTEETAAAETPAAEADGAPAQPVEGAAPATPEPTPVAEAPAAPEPEAPAAAPVGAETDAADIAGIPAHLLKRSKQAKDDKGDA